MSLMEVNRGTGGLAVSALEFRYRPAIITNAGKGGGGGGGGEGGGGVGWVGSLALRWISIPSRED